MDTPTLLVLPVQVRPEGEKAKAIRRKGLIPSVYYGRGKQNLEFMMDYQAFRKVFEKAGENTIVELHCDGKKYPVLVHDVQYNPVTDQFNHADFYHVDMEKEVTTKVPVKLIGVAPAVKNLGGILTTHKHELTIRCLPKYLIHSIEVDVSSLEDFRNSIHVEDIKVSSGIKILDNPGDTVANVRPMKIEEEAPKAAEGTVPAEGAVAAATTGPEGAAVPATAQGPAAPVAASDTKDKKEKKK